MGADADYFEDAQEFKPERWLHDDDKFTINPYLVNIFGFGPRMCLGTYGIMCTTCFILSLAEHDLSLDPFLLCSSRQVASCMRIIQG